MSELDRYLLGSEVCVATARRHWAVLLPQTLGVGICWGAWVWVLKAWGSQYLDIAATFFFIFSFLWLAWLAGEWFTELFAVTDKRVLLVSGLFYKRLAVMPLSKVTDMTYERSPAGRIIGYGTFIMESAGQDQALSRIDYVRDPDRLYHQLSEELFGSGDEDAPAPSQGGNPDGPVFADTTRLPRLR